METFLPLLISMITSMIGSKEHNDYADLLMQQQKTMPPSMKRSEELYAALAKEGLPGKQLIQQSISDQIQRAYGSAQEALGSYPDLFSYLTDLQTKEAQSMNAVEIQNAQQRMENILNYARFLSTVKAPTEWDIEQFNIDKVLAAERERMSGTSESMENVMRGVGGSITLAGQSDYNDYLKDKLDTEKKFFDEFFKNPSNTTGQDKELTYDMFKSFMDKYNAGMSSTSNPFTNATGFSAWDQEDLWEGLLGGYAPR